MMKRGLAVLLIGLLAVGVVAAAPAAAAFVGDGGTGSGVGIASTTDAAVSDEDDGNETLPGERLGGVVGVQGSEIDGEVESRAFENRVAADRSDEERADAIAEKLRENEARLDELEDGKADLRERRNDGEISEGEYRARVAKLAAETARIQRTTNRSAAVAAELPAERLEERGIDGESIRALQNRASELSGPEVAEIAQGIAGPNVGGPVGPDRAGPPTNGTPTDRLPTNQTPGNTSEGAPGNDGGSPDAGHGADADGDVGSTGNGAGADDADTGDRPGTGAEDTTSDEAADDSSSDAENTDGTSADDGSGNTSDGEGTASDTDSELVQDS